MGQQWQVELQETQTACARVALPWRLWEGGREGGGGWGGAKNAMKHRTHTQNTDGRR